MTNLFTWDVPRETSEKIHQYLQLLKDWNRKVPLVSRKVFDPDPHVRDALDLAKLLSTSDPLVDVGSGGGFPGLVLNILGYSVTLVEKDFKKSLFLSHVVDSLGLSASVVTAPIQEVSCQGAPVLVSRATFSVINFLRASSHLTYRRVLLPKGDCVLREIEEARKLFEFQYNLLPRGAFGPGHFLEVLPPVALKRGSP